MARTHGSGNAYSGSNPHDQHVHVSVADDASLYDDASPWDIGMGVGVPNPIAPRKTLPVLRKGSRGFYVSMLQTCLGGSVTDGDFGPLTEQAVKQFQRDHELDDDGVVGVYTWRELLRPWAKEVNLLPQDPRAKLTEMALVAQKAGATASVDELLKAFLVIIEDILPPGYDLTPPVVIVPPPTRSRSTSRSLRSRASPRSRSIRGNRAALRPRATSTAWRWLCLACCAGCTRVT